MEHLLAAIDQREGEVFTPMIGAASSSSLSISSPTFNDEDSRNLPSNDCYDRRYHFAMTHEQQSTFTGSGTTATATASVDRGITWQEMFQQLKDFRELRHHRIPPRLDRWMNAQRRQYSMYGIGTKQPTGIITNRIRQLNSIGFEWNVGVSSECFTQPPLPTPPPPSSQSKHSFNDHCIRTWTEEEDEAILRLQMQWGNAWKKIATELNTGRSESKVRHRWLALDRMGRRSYISTDDDSGRCMDMDIESEDEAVVEEVIEIDDDDDIDEQDNAQYEVDKNVVQSCEFTVDHDRTDHVERLVKDALKRERRPRGAVKSRTAVTPKKSSGRIRKPSRRVQESYLTLGSNSSSSYNNNSEGEEYCMQSNDALAVGCSSDRHDNNSSQGLNRHLHGSQRPESIRTTSKREQFPETLFRMVNTFSETEPHIIKWVPDGSAFQVKDISLIPAVLHRYFRHSNYVSFNRMLQLYGFNRHTTGRQLVDEFHHPYFTRSSSRDSLVSFVTKCTEAPPPLGNTIPLKSMKVKVGEGCGKGFSSDIVATDLPRRNVNTNGVKNTVAPNSNDVLMSLKNHEYKQVMFDYFKMLGVKDGADDNDTIKRMTGEIMDIFKRGMGETGRFYRKVRGARTVNGRFALQDEASTLSRISSDLRRRMESANYWLEEWREEEGSIKPSAILSEKEMKENTHSKFTGEDNDDDDNDDIESNVKQDDDDESKSSDITASAPCMCKKSKCLKLYCDCFNKEKYCSGCSCIGCNNTHRHNSVRVKAIANIKERNPDAFMPKIKSSIECKCKRTSCLKKYCDCFLHGVYCTETCQCSMCKNVSRKSHANAGLTFNNEASENDDTNFPTSNSSSTTMDSSDHHTASAIQSQKAKVANTASKATTVTPPPKSKPRESDIILSLRNDEYKEIMFTQFRTMGKRLDSSENAVLDAATHELFAVFKRIMGKDGRFLRSDRNFRDLWVADDEEAVLKIKRDLKRRNDSLKHWQIE